jgi:hypothetical protein
VRCGAVLFTVAVGAGAVMVEVVADTALARSSVRPGTQNRFAQSHVQDPSARAGTPF